MITENKMHHIISVARKCKDLAKKYGMSDDMQDACFIMGFLHDIGYENCKGTDIINHPQIGYNMLENYEKYHFEIMHAIRDHGQKYDNLSKFDEILNEADLTIDHIGKPISVEERLESIKFRHNGDEHYQHAVKQAAALKKIKSNRKKI